MTDLAGRWRIASLGGRWRVAVLGGLFLASVFVAVRLVRPLHSGSVGPDAIAPVIEFERLAAGQAIEGRLTQTSKPLLDLVYGPLFALFHDWRPVAWAAIVAFALCVVLAAVLAHRVAGLASAAFAAASFMLSPILLVDLGLAYAVVWMLLFLLVAGLAVTAQRPRYGLAGVALAVAALARPEALAVVGVAFIALIGAEIGAVVTHRPRPPRRAYLTLLGLLAIPIFIAHDEVLFGDPLFWLNTAEIASQGRKLRGLVAMVGWMWQHFLGQAALLPLAGASLFVLVSRRQWQLAIGLAGVILGIAGLFIVSGARGTFLSSRYLVPIDLGLLFAAAVGVSALDVPAIRRWLRRRIRPNLRTVLLPVAGGLAVALAIAPIAPLNATVRAAIDTQVKLHANAKRAFEAIRREVPARPTWHRLPPSGTISDHPLLIVPPTLRAQAVADLDLPLTEVAYSYETWLDPLQGKPTAGTIVYHDRLDDHPGDPRYSLVEIDRPTIIGSYRYVPILVDKTAGLWVVRVEAASPP
ncbi:MAG: hypothetical protein QOF11_874 [Chloroflexota bacterium]|nr:hypothetical protein [Chloroflexota bacterium]